MRMFQRRTFLTMSLALGACLGALCLTSPSFGAAEPLPSQITDDAFWQMVSDFSEDGGYFRSENFLSNELLFQFIVPTLKETLKPGGVYLGVGPEQNFTYLVALQPKIAFIIDIRRQNMVEHLMYKALFEMSADRAEFLSRLFSRKRPPGLNAEYTTTGLFQAYRVAERDPESFRQNLQAIKDLLVKKHKFGLTAADEGTLEHVYKVFFDAGPDLDYSFGAFNGGRSMPTYAELMVATDEQGKNWSYLATEENFQILREMEKKNLIVPVVGDFAGPKAVRTVAQYLKEHDAPVTVFYTSNVEQYLFQQANDWEQFYSNVATLPLNSSSTFIRSVNTRSYLQGGPYPGQSQSVLSPMLDHVSAFKEGRIRSYLDVIQMSKLVREFEGVAATASPGCTGRCAGNSSQPLYPEQSKRLADSSLLRPVRPTQASGNAGGT